MSDLRDYRTLYGFYIYDWEWTFGSFADHHYVLDEDYVSDGADTMESSEASVEHQFLLPWHIKKTFFIEGTIRGHITLMASQATSTVTEYRVSVCRMNEDTTDEELYTTGWVVVDDTLDWDTSIVSSGIGEETVYPFWIDAWEEKELSGKDRLYVKVEVSCDEYCYLAHSNDKTWEDLKVEIPLVL